MPLESPNNLRYSLIVGATTTVLDSTPLGWSEESVARTRTEDNGVNSEITVPLSFVKDGYTRLHDLYYHVGIYALSSEKSGQFAVAYLQIDKKRNDWDFELFYKYRLDFSKCTDKLYEFEIAGIEEGLAVKFEKYKDTEYEVDLPITGKIFLDYTGASYTDKNVIQCGFGDIQRFQKPDIVVGDDAYALQGSRSVRSYNDKVTFTDTDGLPYETFTFRALKDATIDLVVYPNVTIEADAAILQTTPAAGNLKLIEHDAAFANPVDKYTFDRTATTTTSNNRIDTFGNTETFSLVIDNGKLYTLFYIADEKSYDMIKITEGSDCRLEISNLITSTYQNSKLEAFTYEWLIAELLKKIEPTLASLPNVTDYFESTITYPNVKELLSATPCIKNIGKTSGLGKLKTTLKDVLESYHKLKCTAIDITGNKMTITPLASAYDSSEDNGELVAANITVMHDTKHQYNKVKVGADTDDREDDDPLIYPFICEKEFSVEDSLADAELNLVNNFMLDPYQIDKYVRDTNGDSDNKDECKFMVFACTVTESQQIYEDPELLGWNDSDQSAINIRTVESEAKQLFTTDSLSVINFSFATQTNDDGSLNTITTIMVSNISETNIIYQYVFVGRAEDDSYSITVPKGSWKLAIKCTTPQSLGFTTIIENQSLLSGYDLVSYIDVNPIYDYIIYKEHDKPITGFSGDSNTIYNIPLTPKRILQTWQNYLAISLVGATTKALKFGTTTILNSAIESKCDYEAEIVKENVDLSLTGIDPTFFPSLINFDTYNDYDRILDDNPYGYYSLVDKKTGRAFKGYVNKTSYSVGANQTQQWELQAKEL